MKDETKYYTCFDLDVKERNRTFKFCTPFERLIYLQLLEYFRFEDGIGENGSVKTTVKFK